MIPEHIKILKQISRIFFIAGIISILLPIIFSFYVYSTSDNDNTGGGSMLLLCYVVLIPYLITIFSVAVAANKRQVLHVRGHAVIVLGLSLIFLIFSMNSFKELDRIDFVRVTILLSLILMNTFISVIAIIITKNIPEEPKRPEFPPVPQPKQLIYHCKVCNNILIYKPQNKIWYCEFCKKD